MKSKRNISADKECKTQVESSESSKPLRSPTLDWGSLPLKSWSVFPFPDHNFLFHLSQFRWMPRRACTEILCLYKKQAQNKPWKCTACECHRDVPAADQSFCDRRHRSRHQTNMPENTVLGSEQRYSQISNKNIVENMVLLYLQKVVLQTPPPEAGINISRYTHTK